MGAIEVFVSQRARKRKLALIAAGAVAVAVVLVAVVCLAVRIPRHGSHGRHEGNDALRSGEVVCRQTEYEAECLAAMNATLPEGSDKLGDGSKALIRVLVYSLSVAKNLMNMTSLELTTLANSNQTSDDPVYIAASECTVGLDEAVDRMDTAIDLVMEGKLFDALEELNMVATLNTDCAESLYRLNDTSKLPGSINTAINLAMNLVNAMKLTDIATVTSSLTAFGPTNRRLAMRRLLAESQGRIDYVVAKDGSGQFDTVQAALNKVPLRPEREEGKPRGCRRVVIHVKAGRYVEKAAVNKNSCPVTLIGDGKTNTVISWNDTIQTVRDGKPVGTWGSYTFWARGDGFIGVKIGVENTAGIDKFQAVALLAQGRKIVFIDSGFSAFQDTLYARAGSQYYTKCTIKGTVDMIFGNAAAVFDSCNVTVRPKNGQTTVTAQGRTDENQRTGFVFHSCRIDAERLLNGTSVTFLATNQYMVVYLGRPWRPYARVVYIGCYLGTISPEGYLKWALTDDHKTAEYYEYKCYGPGANRSDRVGWSHTLSAKEAEEYTVENFLESGGKNPWVESRVARWWG
ncbi:hypothetical protein CBR_g4498 [Chara braunii]|uniref:Pectinesterase n=1 Tax=Chara braunii TaxID=69332 RepID=A0A388KI36_CHABU|nr:hypothetical protein CBR_g4498 [Chara braunii]|eukprot:GBG69668.1 hypothetical protein CBR_g4498 [Chara braunii]